MRSLSRTTRALPEIDRVFHENEDILSETRAHVRTFQDQGLVYCGTLWSPLYTFNTVKLLHCSNEGCCCDWKKDRERRKFACILWKTFYPPILLFSETQALIMLFFLTFLFSGKTVTFTSFFSRHNSSRKFVQYGLKTICFIESDEQQDLIVAYFIFEPLHFLRNLVKKKITELV